MDMSRELQQEVSNELKYIQDIHFDSSEKLFQKYKTIIIEAMDDNLPKM